MKPRLGEMGAKRSLPAINESLEVILVGDSGEKDPEIYNQIACTYPTLVSRIIIRTLTPVNYLPFAEVKATATSSQLQGIGLLERFHPNIQSRVQTYTSGNDFPLS